VQHFWIPIGLGALLAAVIMLGTPHHDPAVPTLDPAPPPQVEASAPEEQATIPNEIQPILHALDQLPDHATDQHLELLEAAAKTSGSRQQLAERALFYASRAPASKNDFDQYVYPMTAYELYLTNAEDRKAIIPGTLEVLKAHSNPATRRLIRKYFAAAAPDLRSELEEDIEYLGL